MFASSLPRSVTNEEILSRIKNSEPIIGEAVLLNGARFLSASVPKSPHASIAIHFDAGSRREAPGEFGALHFFEHLPGASFRIANNGIDLVQYAEARGWEIDIEINRNRLTFGFSTPDFEALHAMATLEELLGYESDVFQSVFQAEKGRILNEIAIDEQIAESQNHNFLCNLLMEKNGYAHPVPGYRQEVKEYTLERIASLGQRFLSPANATVAVVGNEIVIDQAQAFFSNVSFPSTDRSIRSFELNGVPEWSSLPNLSTHVSPHTPGISVDLIFPGRHIFDFRESIALEALSGMLSRALNRKLSQETGLTYAAAVAEISFAESTYFIISSNVEPENFHAAFELLAQTVEAFPSTITEEMYRSIFIKHRNDIYMKSGTFDYSINLEYYAVYPKRVNYGISEMLDTLASFNVEELRILAAKYFNIENAKLVLHGSEDAIGEIAR